MTGNTTTSVARSLVKPFHICVYLTPIDMILGTGIMHLTVAGRSIVIVDTYEVASNLLDKKSAIYSSRYARDHKLRGCYLPKLKIDRYLQWQTN